MAPYQVLIFDFDGTLCATQDSILYSFEQTFAHYNTKAPTAKEIMQAVSTGGSLPEILPLVQPGLSKKELANWVQTYRQIYSASGGKLTTLFAGTIQLLQSVKAAGLQCAVISNKGQQAIEEALQHFNISNFFDLIIGDNPVLPLKKKPDPMAFHEVITPHYGYLQKEDFLMVGDTHVDLEFAQNAGIDSCWANYGYGDPALCLKVSPTHTISHLSELTPLVLPANT